MQSSQSYARYPLPRKQLERENGKNIERRVFEALRVVIIKMRSKLSDSRNRTEVKGNYLNAKENRTKTFSEPEPESEISQSSKKAR